MPDLVQRLRQIAPYFAPHALVLVEAADALEVKDIEIAELESKFMQTHNWLCDRNEQIADLKETLKDHGEIQADLCKEITKLNTEYQEACRLVAQMHLAAVGGVVGPKLGVIEDVKALKESHDKYKALCDQLGRALDGHCAPFLGHEQEHADALAAWRESK